METDTYGCPTGSLLHRGRGWFGKEEGWEETNEAPDAPAHLLSSLGVEQVLMRLDAGRAMIGEFLQRMEVCVTFYPGVPVQNIVILFRHGKGNSRAGRW